MLASLRAAALWQDSDTQWHSYEVPPSSQNRNIFLAMVRKMKGRGFNEECRENHINHHAAWRTDGGVSPMVMAMEGTVETTTIAQAHRFPRATYRHPGNAGSGIRTALLASNHHQVPAMSCATRFHLARD